MLCNNRLFRAGFFILITFTALLLASIFYTWKSFTPRSFKNLTDLLGSPIKTEAHSTHEGGMSTDQVSYSEITTDWRPPPSPSSSVKNETVKASVIESLQTSPKPTPVPFSQLNISSTLRHKCQFNGSRDARDYGLAAECCVIGFPGLFSEIDRSIARQKMTGMVTIEDIDIAWKETGAVRGLIYNRQVTTYTREVYI